MSDDPFVYKFQFTFIGDAVLFNPVMATTGGAPGAGEVSCPLELNTNVPVVGGAGGVASPGGMPTEKFHWLGVADFVNWYVSVWALPSES